MKIKNRLTIVGQTGDGHYLFSGVFKLSDTYGIPLEITLENLRKKKYLVAWDIFIKDALKAGWKPKKILATIEAGLVDSGTHRGAIKIVLEKAQKVLGTLC